ncbi:Stk1 family PASTA domain-containing Ser/Thr kinase [Bifidobacterium aerophilum]|uniref:non-specific serine/threonine protein kinase n=1 Tax=Bifidobacterium aerophilum TaxID=1798155 RepID=A0A6N9Z6Y6_9BIFI|nr:Stk1 family PASTA domain-containing Ser/Thr kinase [Bifidobacterium aerophilum]NEG90477.1 Stk1 family PASTA domain-containing Ser/Thr kinase [Bifidobacterium aerophilum]
MSSTMPNSLADGRYQLGQLIGRGGMAEVRVALDTRLGRTVAVKIMRADLANDQIFLSRFRREAHAVAQMNNPNIVNIYDSGEETVTAEDGGTEHLPYLVMEYVKGQTLRDIIKANGALSQRDAEQVMLGVLNALEYSHRMGIIHRDIKPGNIMISEQGIVKVMDFGIARALDDSAATMTQSQGVVGTAQYLSPEQARGETVDMRSDLYSAGCVLYEMLTGRPPFTGDSAVAIAYQHVSEVATPPSALVPGLPKMWDSICAKAMAKDRQNRYATAAEFKTDILTFMNGGVPVATAFNPLTDLSNMKARKQAEQNDPTATAAMSPTMAMPTAAMPGAAETATTQAFNPVTGQFEAIPAMQPAGGTTVKSRAEQRAEAAQANRKKKIIIGSIIGAIVAIIAILGIYVALHGGASMVEEQVEVPDFTSMSGVTKDKVRAELKKLGLTPKITDDATSDKPEGTVTKQDPDGGTKVDKGTTVEVWFSSGPQSTTVPDVSDMTQSKAISTLTSADFKVADTVQTVDSTIEKDKVVKTDPEAGSSQAKGSTITLYVSTGKTAMPDVTGQPLGAAQQTLTGMGLGGSMSTSEEYDDNVPEGSVISTNPAAGEYVDSTMTISIVVSKGKQPVKQVTLPTTIALGTNSATVSAVTAQLEALGLKVEIASGNPTDGTAIVTAVNPGLGQTVDEGSTVTLTTKSATNSGSNGGSGDNSGDDGGNDGGNTGGDGN